MSSTKKPNAQNSKGRSGSEEPLQQPFRQHAGDTAAVVAARKRRLHRHDPVAIESNEARKDAISERTAAARVGSLKEHRPRIGAREGGAQIRKNVAVAAQRHRHPAYRIFDRAPDADFV